MLRVWCAVVVLVDLLIELSVVDAVLVEVDSVVDVHTNRIRNACVAVLKVVHCWLVLCRYRVCRLRVASVAIWATGAAISSVASGS